MRNDLLLPRTRIEGNQIYSFGRPYKTIVGLEPSYRYVSRMNGHKCAYLELKTTKSYLIAHRKYVYRCLTNTKILLWSFASNSTNTDECWNGFPRKQTSLLTRVIGRPLLRLDVHTDVVR